MQLGVRQARYFGRAKTLFQLILAATVANLTLVAGKLGLLKGQEGRKNRPSSPLWTPLVALVLAFRAWFRSSLAPRPQGPLQMPVESKPSISWLGGSASRTATNGACRPGF